MGLISIITVTLIALVACTIVTAKSVRRLHKREASFRSCNQIFLAETSVATNNIDTRVGHCRPLSTRTKTTVALNSVSSSCNYSILGFTEDRCGGDHPQMDEPLQGETTLNKRTSICSFLLVQRPTSTSSIKFTFADGGEQTIRRTRKGCHNLCANSASKYEPISVTVYDRPNVPTVNNSIMLFSGIQCQEETLIQANVKEEPNLAALTQSQPVLRSYMIVREMD